MNILVTGAFGTVGLSVINELKARNHEVNIFDLKNNKNKKQAKLLKKSYQKLIWGDIRNKEDIKTTINRCDCIIHLAALVPPDSELNEKLCNEINAEGTNNLLEVINELGKKTPIVFTSSASIMGPTQFNKQPVSTSDNINPVTLYSKSKSNAENYITNSSCNYCILRLASVLSTVSDYSDDLLKLLFDFPLECRNEIIMDSDAAVAIVSAAEKLVQTNEINRRIYFIGGGKENGCQLTNRKMIKGMFEAMGIGMLSEKCFTEDKTIYSMDWYDTKESDRVLDYQKHSFNDYIEILKIKTQNGGFFVKFMAPKLKKTMELQSPYFIKSSEEK
ncbi:MAG: SDR family oxidoreductase [Clostridiales bacterium]|nr:SDR family oxidoreductase [Clostridiales bacterium]